MNIGINVTLTRPAGIIELDVGATVTPDGRDFDEVEAMCLRTFPGGPWASGQVLTGRDLIRDLTDAEWRRVYDELVDELLS